MLLIRYCVLVNKLLIVWLFLLYEACDRNPAKVFFFGSAYEQFQLL